MATTQNYPSPTHAQMSADGGPFYNNHTHDQPLPGQSAATQEVPDDLQLRADLSRSLAAITGNPTHTDAQRHDPSLQYDQGRDEHAHLAQSIIEIQENEQSPGDTADSDARTKDKRQKVSRACDECRRKKVHIHLDFECG